MTDHEPDYRPREQRSFWPAVLLLIVLGLAAWFGWRWWQQSQVAVPAAPPAVSAPAPEDRAEPDSPAPAGPQNPAEAIAEADADLPALAEADAKVREAVTALLGSRAVAGFLQMDGFVRRIVATADNLPRDHAAPALWPVRPTPGRMPLQGEGEMRTVAPENGARYAPFVRLSESVDPAAGARVYARLYPLFQQAYEELGYPGRYFNDRLVAVVDHLLAAPVAEGPLAIRVVEVRGEVPGDRPWVRYEYADPRLESLSAGHKLMLRMGPDNAGRLKAVLRAWRAQLATAVPGKPAS